MNKQEITKVVELARWYPSGDNCQPFRFVFINDELQINYHANYAKHALIYNNDLILMTLGFAAEYSRNALHNFKFNFEISFNLEGFCYDKDQLNICCFKLIEKENSTDCVMPFIAPETLLSRVTDRRQFKNPNEISQWLSDYLKQCKYANCKDYYDVPKNVLKFFADCDSLIWTSKKLGVDIMNSVSFAEPPGKTGLPWRNLGLAKLETLPIKWIQNNNKLFNLFSALGSRKTMAMSQMKLWNSSKSCLVFSTPNDCIDEHVVKASMEMLNCILTLSERNYHVQPSTISTLVLNYPLQSTTNLQTTASVDLDSIASKVNETRNFLGLKTEKIQWILRFGQNIEPVPKENRTLRLPVNELLKIE
jgi:hypothetical protein